MKNSGILFFTRTIYALVFFSALFVSCERALNPNPDGDDKAPRLVQKVNDFVFNFMDDIYLWNAEMPKNIDRKYEKDSKVYFDKLLYKKEDKWSFITDDYEAVSQGGEGVETTFGYSIHNVAYTLPDKNIVFIIQFVYPNTPASKAGLKRGDIIYRVDNTYITDANLQEIWRKLFTASSISLQLAKRTDSGITPDISLNLTAVKMQLSAIIEKKVFEIEGKKIGYLFYSDFFGGSETELSEVFQWFKTQGVNNFVLDLRYNLGGYGYVATHLASIVAPISVVNAEKVLITYQWNASYQKYWEQQKEYDRIRTLFKKDVPVNLNLNRIYVLTTINTASASEFVITGLEPYMEVIKIGSATRGKYTGAILFQAQYYSNGKWVVDKEIKNWGIQPIVERYANALGVTDFKEGFKPDYAVTDISNTLIVKQLGDPQEPLLGKALELITGVSYAAAIGPATKSYSPTELHLTPHNDYFQGSVLRKIY